MKISFIIPCYNEEQNVKEIYSQIGIYIPEGFSKEVLFIDDGSSDHTLQNLKDLAAENTDISFISFSRNFGHQSAIKAGLDFADGDAVIMMDSDMQHPPSLIPDLVKMWKSGFDIVYTVRKDTNDESQMKKITSRVFYRLLNAMSNVHIPAGTADFRLVDRKVADKLRELNEIDVFWRGLISWVGFKQAAIEYYPAARKFGASKYSLRRMLRLGMHGITSFSDKPLLFGLYLGFIISLCSFAYIVYALMIYFFSGEAVSGWASTIISNLFLGGVQLMLMGLIGLYVGRIFRQVKNRPHYIIKEISNGHDRAGR